MSKLIPTEEIQQQLGNVLDAYMGCHPRITKDEIRDIQRNVLEAAAKHLRHQADCADAIEDPHDAALWRLAAIRVLELIPKNPAPAGPNKKGGGNE